MTQRLMLVALGFGLLAISGLARGDVVLMKDGTKIEGVVIRQGDNYWVKTTDGESRQVPVGDVASVTKGGAKPSEAPAPKTTPAVVLPTPAAVSEVTFSQTKRKADLVDNAATAVTIWQAFVDTAKADNPDLANAKAELDKWKKMVEDGAQKVNGKWVSGDERRKLSQQVLKLCNEAFEDLMQDRTLRAPAKLQEALKLNPSSYSANALLGYMAMMQHNIDDSMKYFDAALKTQPEAVGVMVNQGILYIQEKKQYDRGIMMIYKAALIEDDQGIAQDLILAMVKAPDAIRNSAKMKPVLDAANLLASKYHISTNQPAAQQKWVMLVPLPMEGPAEANKQMAGVIWNGTGFLVSADGLILTNRHVAKDAPKLKVIMSDGERMAKVVKIDDDQDLALIKIEPKPGEKLPFIQLTKGDGPADGADIVVMGFPMAGRLGMNIKITRGIVSSGSARGECDVLVDAKVNPGNSGGPMLDRYGNVAAIVSMKSLTSETEDSYGMGISAGRIRRFLLKNKVEIEAAGAGSQSMSAEEIAAKVKPAAVCILAIR